MRTIDNPTGNKAVEKQGKVIVTYPKLAQDKFGAPNKNGNMRVLFRFLAKLNKVPMVENDVLFHIILPSNKNRENAVWFRDNVIRYVDIDNTGNDSVAEAKADKLIEKYYLADPEGTHKMGVEILEMYAQQMYVAVSVWELEE